MAAPLIEIRLATAADLAEVETWLVEELEQTGSSFYCNWSVIQRGAEYDGTFVMLRDGRAVAVLVDGIAGPSILTVRRDLRKQGLGGRFARWLLERAMSRNLSVLEIECEPRASVPFWQQHGFLPMADGPDGDRHQFRLLERSHMLPDGPDIMVTISLFPEEKNWDPSTSPYWVRTEMGRRQSGRVQLPTRVALYARNARQLSDCVVRLDVDGTCVYEGKPKSLEARDRGINQDQGSFYYIDDVS